MATKKVKVKAYKKLSPTGKIQNVDAHMRKIDKAINKPTITSKTHRVSAINFNSVEDDWGKLLKYNEANNPTRKIMSAKKYVSGKFGSWNDLLDTSELPASEIKSNTAFLVTLIKK